MVLCNVSLQWHESSFVKQFLLYTHQTIVRAVTVYLNLPDFGYNIFKLVVAEDPSQGLSGGIEAVLLVL
jgi:hypothetical protein